MFFSFPGQTFKFICGRWLGQSVDDGSTERYMVGYPALNPSSLEKELTNELSFTSSTDHHASNPSSNIQDLIQLVQECSNSSPETTCPPMQLKVIQRNNQFKIQNILFFLGCNYSFAIIFNALDSVNRGQGPSSRQCGFRGCGGRHQKNSRRSCSVTNHARRCNQSYC